MDSPVLFPTRIGKRASASNGHWFLKLYFTQYTISILVFFQFFLLNHIPEHLIDNQYIPSYSSFDLQLHVPILRVTDLFSSYTKGIL